MISYGYGINNGEIVVIEEEAKIVRLIFNEYCLHKALKTIAQELTNCQVEFYNGSCQWNKNNVARIIENDKYVGANNYPRIITVEQYDKANAIKTQKGNQKIEQTAEIEHMKEIVFCTSCGKKYRRIPKWRSREKWICSNGCKCEKYIDDAKLYQGIREILKSMRDSPDIFSVENKGSTFNRTIEIARYNNELAILMNEREPSFKVGKKIILANAALRFRACEFCGAEYDDVIAKKIESSESDIPWEIIKRIEITSNGAVIVKFINGVSLSNIEKGGKPCGNTSQESCYENRCKSTTFEAQ